MQAGDIVLCHSKGFIGAAIRFGQWLRRPKASHWYSWNHVAILESYSGGEWQVIQAEAHGVTRSALSTIAPGGRYEVVPCPDGVDRSKVIAYAAAQVGTHYGFLTIASIAVNLLTPTFLHLDIRRQGTLICSALGAISLLAGGYMHPWHDLYQVMPAELAEALGSNPVNALSAHTLRSVA